MRKFDFLHRCNKRLILRYIKSPKNSVKILYLLNYASTTTLLKTKVRLAFKKKKTLYIINRSKLKSKSKRFKIREAFRQLTKFKKTTKFHRLKLKGNNIVQHNKAIMSNSNIPYNSFLNSKSVSAYNSLSLRSDSVPRPINLFKLASNRLRVNNTLNKFILTYVSLFINFKLVVLNFRFKSEKFLMKKLLYSFLKPNEAKRSIMNRRKRIFTTRFYKHLQNSNISSRLPLINKYARSKININKTLFNNRAKNIMHTRKSTTNSDYELFLPRVKFKPGYQRIWRQARLAIAESLGLKYIYQKQMTKYITRLSRKVNSYSFSMSESSLDKAILYSRLLPDLKTINSFMNINLIYLNSWRINRLDTFVLPGDFIQITIGKWLSVYFRWLTIWAKQNKNKFKKLIFRKGLASSYKLMKQKKQRSRHVPLWIYNSRFDISDIKPNYEVDYFTMSSFVLYEPLLIDYYTPDDLPDHRHYVYRLYNWKYIT